MRIVQQIILLACLLIFSGTLHADEPQFPRIPWRVGQWASYQIKPPEGPARLLDLAIVGKKRIDDRDHYWIELAGKEEGQAIVIAQLVSRKGQQLKDIMVQRGRRPPTALRPGSWVRFDAGEGLKPFLHWIPETQHQPKGRESLIVFAGRFQTLRFEQSEGKYWFAADVPITGLVQARTKDLGQVTLMAYGLRGVTSRLKGKPQRLASEPEMVR